MYTDIYDVLQAQSSTDIMHELLYNSYGHIVADIKKVQWFNELSKKDFIWTIILWLTFVSDGLLTEHFLLL